MTIATYDGGKLKCNTIKFYDNEVIADDIYQIPIIEIFEITEDDEEEV